MVAIGGDLALHAHDRIALVVHDGDDRAGKGSPERARLDRVDAGAVADEAVELGLAVALVHGAAEELLGPAEEVGAEDLGSRRARRAARSRRRAGRRPGSSAAPWAATT